ncbi:MAG: FAD-dependent oxidoreductase [Candidatus Marinimicrobia bacterium]|jgi:predicted NAD/FAD-binding protein|nr:FAD-dependent oxidoreductase [Candidatus Neomarinimicrobiota bacterium]|tara:strand:- start:544 stop:1788 length:1245 start_codon:yes stop_codon:yes gene_type:complete
MKIAIIGSGISGLTASYLLNKRHEITLFEKNDYIGGHTHTHDITIGEQTFSIDSGFIVYNEKTYPNFIKLLDILNVERQKTTMGFSVKSEVKNLEYAGNSLKSLFAQKRNYFRPSFLRMLADIIRFNKKAKTQMSMSPQVTLGQYLEQNSFSQSFINHYIIPMGAAIWSTTAKLMMDMPALFFIKFFNNHGLLQIKDRSGWWVIKDGSKEYVKKIIEPFQERIRVKSEIKTIKRSAGKIIITHTAKGDEEIFDAVVIGTHSNQALKLLADPTEKEHEILGAIPYQTNSALLHTDTSILPKRKLAWASWNYYLDQDEHKPVMLTYNMNILQRLDCDETFCVTLNSNDSIDQNKIIKELNYEHPLFTHESIKAQGRKNEISGVNNTYYCGAYWRNGFHEDGVVSALDVCKNFGIEL